MEKRTNIVEFITVDDRINNDALANTLKDVDKDIQKGKTAIAVIDRVIEKEDGSTMYEYIGSNVTTIGGTQTMVENLFDNLNPSSGLNLKRVDDQAALTASTGSANWKFEGMEGDPGVIIDKEAPRKIFGFMLGTDGAVGPIVKVVNRRTKGFEHAHLVPLFRQDISLDNPLEKQHLGVRNSTERSNDINYIKRIRESINHGKYALRVKMPSSNENSQGDIAYFIKVANFDYQNVYVDNSPYVGEQQELDEDTFKAGQDVRTKVTTIIDLPAGVVSKSINKSVVDGDRIGAPSATHTLVSSIMLVAGRPATVTVSNPTTTGSESTSSVNTYRDIIVTNKATINELPFDNMVIKLRYTLYFV